MDILNLKLGKAGLLSAAAPGRNAATLRRRRPR
jgi:hypothetical protein